MKAKFAVAAVITLCCLATFAASARADSGGAVSTPSVACHWTVGPGLFTLSCTTGDGAVYQCSLTFSWANGLGLSCTGPNGSLVCSSRPTPTCTTTTPEGTRTFRWER